MDTLTHALSGALLARATTGLEKPALPVGRRMAIGALVAAFPDLDVVTSWISPLAYLYNHRGVTHSLVMLPLWTVLLAWIFALIWRGGPGWKTYAPVVALSLAAHIAGDWITTFGTMIFAPLSDYRHGIGTTFIIDLWFSGIIIAGLLLSLLWRRSRVPAVAGLVVLAGYVVLQSVLLQQAVEFGRGYAQTAGLTQARVSALPRPVSPFNWMVVIEDDQGYRYSQINLIRKEVLQAGDDAGFIRKLDAVYRPLDQAVWETDLRYGRGSQGAVVRAVFEHPQFEFFRWFSAYPALHRIDSEAASLCIWFKDLRFLTPGRGSLPFIYGMCSEGAGPMRAYGLDGGTRFPVY
ncbi:MAG: metal-dependent hydrolase [Burkholderiales bacterium]|nr:metal-dependent hydrolase [Burkholderiales bacterium]